MNCPSCGAEVPFGETICLDCGTELVLGVSASALVEETADEAGAAKSQAAGVVAQTVSCPDCGERVTPDGNGLCSVCGHDFEDEVALDEEKFFAAPVSIDQAMEIERARLRELGVHAAEVAGRSRQGGAASGGPSAPSAGVFGAPIPRETAPREPSPGVAGQPNIPLPGDRHRERYRSQSTPVVEQRWLIVEGSQTVFFEGRMVSEIRLDVDQLTIGRRDPASGHYPDIDLGHFRNIDPHISRRHARVYRQHGRWYVEDQCANDATFLNDTNHILNDESVPLSDGDRVMISESVVLRFVDGPTARR